MKRFGTTDEQAAAILFLASDEASYITGVPCPWQAATSAEPRRSDRFRLVIRIEGTRDERRQDIHTAAFAERVRVNQQKLSAELKPNYDFIVCGSGLSGSVAARRLAENAAVSVLLLEAGGSDDMPSIVEAGQWPLNLGSERDWGFMGQPNPHINGRSIPLNMGKVLGGGSSINVMPGRAAQE